MTTFILDFSAEEDLLSQELQQPRQQQSQSEAVALLAALQQIEVLVGRKRTREQQTREDDEALS